MKIAIITHVPHSFSAGRYFGYGPYVREMNIWTKNATEVIVVAPLLNSQPDIIDCEYLHPKITFRRVPTFNLIRISDVIRSILILPGIFYQVYKAMRAADHIHLRCPGNMGLIGCLVQILFPRKKKTAKYAGNWDPLASQPWSYKHQKRLLNSTFFTKNMTVLVYGDWPGSSKNIKSFFTASYPERSATVPVRPLSGSIRMLFVGTLSSGKRPLYAIQLVQQLAARFPEIRLDLYGEGAERGKLQQYIDQHALHATITLRGNANADTVRDAYQNSHFLILPSVSEGWPKVVAEAMFWGCVPLASPVSCVPMMLGHGERGLILSMDLDQDAVAVESAMSTLVYDGTARAAMEWSRQYTLERFEAEIRLLLQR